MVVPGEEYSLDSFNLLEGNEIQIHDEFVINDVNVTNQDVPAQNVRPPKRLKISDTDEAQPSVQSRQETGLLTVEGNIDFEPSHEKIQIASAPQPMDEDDLTLDELNNALGPNWYEKSDEVVKHLHELLSSGELPKEHICYKFLKDVIGYIHCIALQGKRQQVCWAWNKDVKEFLRSVRKIRKKRVIRMLRGPGNAGKGRWSDFDINSFNIPIPSLDSVSRDRQKSYTPRSGIITEFLKAFLKMAMKHAIPIIENATIKSIPVVRSIDGSGLKAGCQRDQIINELIGATVKIDLAYIAANPDPDPAKLKDRLVKEAESEVLTTLDSNVTLPIGVNYVGNRSGQDTYQELVEHVQQIQICERCLDHVQHDISCIRDTGEQCKSFCQKCGEEKKVCDECCRRGFVSIDPAMRPCSHCLEEGRQCRKVVVYINSSDCGSNYKESMQICNELRDTGQVELTLQHLRSMPDIIHVVKCLSCSLTNWYLIVEGCRVNSFLLRVIRETEPLGTQMRRVLSLEAVKQRDRMRSQTPRELSSSNVRDLFTCATAANHYPMIRNAFVVEKKATTTSFVRSMLSRHWSPRNGDFLKTIRMGASRNRIAYVEDHHLRSLYAIRQPYIACACITLCRSKLFCSP